MHIPNVPALYKPRLPQPVKRPNHASTAQIPFARSLHRSRRRASDADHGYTRYSPSNAGIIAMSAGINGVSHGREVRCREHIVELGFTAQYR
jgi:hypothetical protein